MARTNKKGGNTARLKGWSAFTGSEKKMDKTSNKDGRAGSSSFQKDGPATGDLYTAGEVAKAGGKYAGKKLIGKGLLTAGKVALRAAGPVGAALTAAELAKLAYDNPKETKQTVKAVGKAVKNFPKEAGPATKTGLKTRAKRNTSTRRKYGASTYTVGGTKW